MRFRRKLNGHEKRIVGARQSWKCAHCDEMLQSTYEVDHVVPLHRGGDDDVSNCHALCKNCHAQKTQREECDRLRERHTRSLSELQCRKCSWIVSRYFIHHCDARGLCGGASPSRAQDDAEERHTTA